MDAGLQKEQSALRGAQAKLASLKAAVGPKGENAQTQLEAAKAKLDQLLNPSASDLKATSSQAVMVQIELESAKTELAQLLNPTAADLADALQKIADARGELFKAIASARLGWRASTGSVWLR